MSRKKEQKRSMFGGLIGSIIAAIIYVAIPYTLLDGILDQIITQIGEGFDSTNIESLLQRWMIAGAPMVLLAFPAWMYPKGSKGRVISWTVYAAYSIAWLLYVTNMGSLESILTMDGMTVSVTILGIIILFVISKILKGIIVLCQYRDHKKTENGSEPMGEQEEVHGDIRIRGRHN